MPNLFSSLSQTPQPAWTAVVATPNPFTPLSSTGQVLTIGGYGLGTYGGGAYGTGDYAISSSANIVTTWTPYTTK